MDTAKDARILILEDALRRFRDIIGNRKLKIHVDYGRLNELLNSAESRIYEIKYSYLPGDQLAEIEATKRIIEDIQSIGESVHSSVKSSGFIPRSSKERIVMAEFEFALRIADGFQRRLKKDDTDAAHAVDVLVVELSQIKKVEGAERLTECRCTDGSRIWNIMTNIPELKQGMKLLCAVLPPTEMMGSVSEAMFLGGEPLPESAQLGLSSDPPKKALDQARAHVLAITKRMI